MKDIRTRKFPQLCMLFALLLAPVFFCAAGSLAAGEEIQSGENARADEPEASAERDQADAAQAGADTEKSGPEQKAYPGVIIKKMQKGGNDEPSVELCYPFFDNAPVDASISAFVEKQAADYEDEVKDAIEPDGERPSSYGMWEMTGFYTLEKPNPDVASITFNIYSYSGGAHGNMAITCLNYDLKTGEALDFASLFKDPERALELMSEYSAARLKKDLGEDADDDMIQSGTSVDLNNFSNLTLVPEGLYIEFQPYQVGPWSIGPQRVEMTLDMLAPAGPEPVVWPNFGKSGQTGETENSK